LALKPEPVTFTCCKSTRFVLGVTVTTGNADDRPDPTNALDPVIPTAANTTAARTTTTTREKRTRLPTTTRTPRREPFWNLQPAPHTLLRRNRITPSPMHP
jgi:hypothetical protein